MLRWMAAAALSMLVAPGEQGTVEVALHPVDDGVDTDTIISEVFATVPEPRSPVD